MGKRIAFAMGVILLAAFAWNVTRRVPELEPPSSPTAQQPNERMPTGEELPTPVERSDSGPSAQSADMPPHGLVRDRARETGGYTPSPAASTASDDDDSAVDPADRTDADPSLVFAPDAEGIQGAVRESLPGLKECYASWLQTQPDLSGRLLVKFVIGPDPDDAEYGLVRDVVLVDSELGHTFMEGCVARSFEDLQFEAPAGGEEMDVSYPVVFASE